jgi:tRNA nucleotidyltransferase/poly(A) polymerase
MQLRSVGFDALFAGGCVRDRLLDRIPKDYDIATSAKPNEVEETFRKRDTYTVPVGAAFGVICVVDPKTKMQVEVATFRSDGAYLDGRRPVNVTFSTPQEDAQRRDFTINGLFLDPETEEVIDYVDGRKDLDAGIVRAIGNPQARFAEDKLRLLRAVRFTATLGFKLEEKTRSAIGQMPEALRMVSAERITGELEKMLLDANRAQGLQLLHEVGLLPMLFPESMPLPGRDALAEVLSLESHLSAPSFPLALAPLLAAVTDARGARDLAKQWRLSSRQAGRISWLVENYRTLHAAQTQRWPRLQRVLIHEGRDELVSLLAAQAACKQADGADLAFCCERVAWPTEKLNPPPLLTGDSLIEAGLSPGKKFAKLLEEVRNAQLEGQVTTPEEAMHYVKRMAAEGN